MTLTKRTITEAGETAQLRARLARIQSADVLHRLTIGRADKPPVLSDEQAAAGHLLRQWVAEAQFVVPTIWDTVLGDRVDTSRGAPLWPAGGSPSPLAEATLRRLEQALSSVDLAICSAVALHQKDVADILELLRPMGFVSTRREAVSHMRRGFESLRVFFDGA